MKTPLISIIVPTYNREHLIPLTLNSVIAQSYTNWECIVVDDGSDDETLNILKNYHKQDSRVLFVKRKRLPKGAPTCRNVGLEMANGDCIIFLDSDDYLLPFCLEQRVKAVNNYPDSDFLVFSMGVKSNNVVKKQEINPYDDYLVPFLSANLPWQTMCPIWHKSFLDELKGFTEGYPRFNDPELMIRAMLQTSVKFKVFLDSEYDSVHVLNVKDKSLFLDSIYESLKLFIPDIVSYLEKNKKISYKHYLAHYLHFWFKYVYVPSKSSNIIKSTHLISLFRSNKIISFKKSLSLFLRLLLYSFSKYFFNKPKNKLTDKALYY